MIYSFRNSGFRDPETGVYNQTYFMEVFNREWHRHMREHQSLALLYLCPHIHETVKQPHLLEFFTKQVQEALLRATDMIARLDHNHFALGLFNIDEVGTEVVLKRIEQQISDFNQDFGKNHKLTIDYKLAACICLPTQENKIESLFSNVSQLSQDLEKSNDQSQALIRLQ
ncbi:diguanylate cyclase [Shewanella baltica]|uniref:diguanylate cyclase domain-containing protein n=1 Tax=Shewanella baltica TaxID=62322 RepID=UPI00217DA2E9|nr:diguanylate cyclase [Shewanella baltica]MCS6129452.1 diguanylate cyclase [Shewanella baltica]MCS6141435.1 diguanylate cyclase [Shewanella baltica]MCS6147720.1 diguanylate cyclase [Shewanella baltica]MCS6172191.1 diguanylate cyclase [Shewanella baltica]MCS6189473.1 diguanylate cyclase [Shewanella baltica]